jgi:hypothetical protein
MKFRNVNPLGAVEVPILGRVLEAGEEFEATGDVAEALLAQPYNYERIDKPEKKGSAK